MNQSTREHTVGSGEHHEAMHTARTSPTLHVPRHVTNREVARRVMGESGVGRFNNSLAVLITKSVGTMWAAYLFVLIALVSFPQALAAFLAGDTVTGITWLSQSFLQLVLLPIIIVGQNVIQSANDARAEADHETLTAIHRLTVEVHAINESQTVILKTLEAAPRER